MASRQVKLRVRGVELRLGLGGHVLGRSQGCDVLLDSSRVSRRHARIEVTEAGVTIEDLGSANGVFVNGFGIGPGPQSLDDGDRILIGGESLHLLIGDSPEPRRRSRTDETTTLPEPAYTDYSALGDEEVPSSVSTKSSNALEIIGQVVDRVLAEGRINDASDMLRAHLRKVLEDAKLDRKLSELTLRKAIEYSVRLADATRRGQWLDYLFQLLAAVRAPLDEDLVKTLRKLIPRVDALNPALIVAYAAKIKASARSSADVWSAQQAELLAREAQSKRG